MSDNLDELKAKGVVSHTVIAGGSPEQTANVTSVELDGSPVFIDDWVITSPPPPNITINGTDGQPLVTIHPDGTLDYGPGYTPDEAARTFWDALRRLMPARCPACGHIGLETP
ncbi:hypothetical protein [Streptomyces sp. 351MFTsu5.1]|uniref:hypothetical protein n=1 Tax=Streptomyces sp. 351MFTsu5.1 TaxID=1172180 RepID=UPI000365F0AE|nr:hypothetical protein [Streptomyces sp. 351MFTsu5.1]